MDSVLRCNSTASRLEPLRGGSLLFTTKFPEITGTHLIDLGMMKDWVDLGATQWFRKRDPGLGIQRLDHQTWINWEKLIFLLEKWN